MGQQPQALGRHCRGGRGAQAERGPRPAHPGQQHALSAAAVRRADRPADPDDLPGRARPGQAHLRRIGETRRVEDGRPLGVRHGRRIRRPTSPPAKSRPAPSRPRSRARPSSSFGRRSRKAPGEPPTLRSPVQQSYCQKVLIALYANGTPFEYRLLEQDHPENFEELKRHWPFGKFPLLLDDGEPIIETTPIIEHLAGPSSRRQPLDPDRRDGAASPLPRPLLRPLRDGQHARCRRPITLRPEGSATTFTAWRRRARTLQRRLRLARRPARRAVGGGRAIHAGRLRRRAVAVLCRLGRGDRRSAPAARRLSRAAARPSGRRPSGRRRAAVPSLTSRSARPTATRRKRPTSAAADRLRSPRRAAPRGARSPPFLSGW